MLDRKWVRVLALLEVRFPELNRTLEAESGDNLFVVMRENGVSLVADCGGLGTCGRCRVIVNGKSQLACRTYLLHDSVVTMPSGSMEDSYEILVDHGDVENNGGPQDYRAFSGRSGYGLAIDIGTTTLVGKLVDLNTGIEVASFAQLNSQRSFGSDVISRINMALDDASVLSGMITSQIDTLVASMLRQHGIDTSLVNTLVVAGNTTMAYLLLGLPCRSLGTAPFTPQFTFKTVYSWGEIFHTSTLSCNCYILPFLSAFVGGDVVAGLCLLGNRDDFILMDMGTNGEILFKRGDRFLCTATAAGPAFEGGCIECGSGSIRGAVSAVRLVDREWQLKTIGAAPATSICGSGILDLMALLVGEGFVDSTGLMTQKTINGLIKLSADSDSPYFTQKDVRQFQLAKSAVRSGVEIILAEMGGELPSHLYLAGGFGQSLNPDSALATGLLPEVFSGRIHAIGNSSLGGATKVCLDESLCSGLSSLIQGVQEINLATHPLFGDLFMEHMGL